MRLSTLSFAFVASLAALSTGCIKSMLTNGQISATREASGAFDTIGDYELARTAAAAGMVQFEGMHNLAPDNEDALFLLTKGWVGYGFAFVEDDYASVNKAFGGLIQSLSGVCRRLEPAERCIKLHTDTVPVE